MLMVPPAVRVFLGTAPCDMRGSFDGLAAMTQEQLGEDPLTGWAFHLTQSAYGQNHGPLWGRPGLLSVLQAPVCHRGGVPRLASRDQMPASPSAG